MTESTANRLKTLRDYSNVMQQHKRSLDRTWAGWAANAVPLMCTLSMDEIAVSFFLISLDNTLRLKIWGRLRRG